MRVLRLQLLCVSTALLIVLAACDRNSNPEMVGHSAPDFTLTDGDRTVSLHDFRGHVTVLNFWASWCPPCLEETPSLIDMQHKLKGQVTLIAVSLDEDNDAYEKFLKDHNVDFLTVRDVQQKTKALYPTTGYPETFIIDQAGVIRRKWVGPIDWTQPEVIRYLAQLQAGRPAPQLNVKPGKAQRAGL